MRKNHFAIISMCFLVMACKHFKRSNNIVYKEVDTVQVKALTNPLLQYRATSTKLWQNIHNKVALSFNYNQKSANGIAQVYYSPYAYPQDSIVLDAKSMRIDKISIVNQASSNPKYFYKDNVLTIYLPKTYRTKDTLGIQIEYEALPYAQDSKGSAAIKDDRGLYFINADSSIALKPVQIWTQGETEATSHWLPCVDKPNNKAPLELQLSFPKKYTSLSNGLKISSTVTDDTRTEIWKTNYPVQVYAYMFAIGAFTKYTEQKQIKEISYYVEPAYEKYASMIFHKTPEMIAFFSSITGVPYPWEKYSQIVVRDYVSGAMENTSASLFGAFMLQDSIAYEDQNYEDVVSHELFHQWFGDYVTAESWSHLTLNESFATYGEYLWRKHQYGINNADELAYDDLQKYLGYAQYNDPTLVRHHYKDKEDMFDRISYQKGGAVLHYMHYLLGDSVFYKAMYFYLNENKFQNAETHQWRLAVEKASGQDWNPFFNEWYYKAGHPKLNIEHIVNIDSGIVQVNIKQVQDSTIGLYHLPIDAWLIYGNEKSLVHWDISKKEQHYTYPIRNGIKPLIIPDAYHVLPAEIYEHKSLSAWKEQMLLKPDFYTQKIVLQHLKKEDAQREEFKEIIRLGLQSPIASIRTNSLELIAKFVNPEHYDTWKAQIIHLTEQESNHKTKATAIAVLGKSKFERKTEMLLQALNEKSYFVQAASVEALYENQYPQKDSLVRALLWHKANTALDQSLWQIISEAAQANDTILFKQLIIPQTDEENRNHWERNTLNYCSKVNNIESFDVLLNTIKQRWKILNDPIVTTDQKVQFYKRFIQTLTTKKDLNQESPLNKQKIQHLQNAIAQLYNPMH